MFGLWDKDSMEPFIRIDPAAGVGGAHQLRCGSATTEVA